MVKISERLRTAAGLIGEGERLADVGTDHGYVPIYLVERKHIPSAIAMDIRTGPLERAREHIRMYGMEDYIQTRLSDGVAALKPDEVDTILVAGMGGGLVMHILESGRAICEQAHGFAAAVRASEGAAFSDGERLCHGEGRDGHGGGEILPYDACSL